MSTAKAPAAPSDRICEKELLTSYHIISVLSFFSELVHLLCVDKPNAHHCSLGNFQPVSTGTPIILSKILMFMMQIMIINYTFLY